MVQDGAPNGKLLLLAASALLLERRRGENQLAVFKTGAFYSTSCDLAGPLC